MPSGGLSLGESDELQGKALPADVLNLVLRKERKFIISELRFTQVAFFPSELSHYIPYFHVYLILAGLNL